MLTYAEPVGAPATRASGTLAQDKHVREPSMQRIEASIEKKEY
jgi:hypothetical protein